MYALTLSLYDWSCWCAAELIVVVVLMTVTQSGCMPVNKVLVLVVMVSRVNDGLCTDGWVVKRTKFMAKCNRKFF